MYLVVFVSFCFSFVFVSINVTDIKMYTMIKFVYSIHTCGLICSAEMNMDLSFEDIIFYVSRFHYVAYKVLNEIN